MEAKSETNKQISSFLFILWAGGAALLSYSLVYALRKPFTAATFDGMDFFGMDYKVATTIMQIFDYSPNPLMCLPYSSTDWHWDACGESSSVS